VRLRPLTAPRGRSSRFARAVLGRYGLRPGRVPPVEASLLRRAAPALAWHLHLRRNEVRVEPRLQLALATARGVERRELRETRIEREGRGAAPPPVEAVVRRSLAERELRVVETRVAREADAVLRRVLARATRLEAGNPVPVPAGASAYTPPGFTGVPAGPLATAPRPAFAAPSEAPVYAPPRLPAPPAVPLVTLPRPAAPAPPAADLRGALAAAGRDAASPAAARGVQPAAVLPQAAPVDVEQLTESVLDAIDRRVVARRERLGRL
jgi:hypothetical protein